MNLEYWGPIANHIWQSTVFAGLLGLLTLFFRKNRAAVRYGLWMAASMSPRSLYLPRKPTTDIADGALRRSTPLKGDGS